MISWALVVFAPFLAPFVAWSVFGPGGAGLAGASPAAWACFAYGSVVSMFLGFFA